MSLELLPLSSSLVTAHTVQAALRWNPVTSRFGLTLTERQAQALARTQAEALSHTGRIEFGGGVVCELVQAFCDSPYLSPVNYEQTLHQLIELFYWLKNETGDHVSDGDLVQVMKSAFDGPCQGSLEVLAEQTMDLLSCGGPEDREASDGGLFEGELYGDN